MGHPGVLKGSFIYSNVGSPRAFCDPLPPARRLGEKQAQDPLEFAESHAAHGDIVDVWWGRSDAATLFALRFATTASAHGQPLLKLDALRQALDDFFYTRVCFLCERRLLSPGL